MTSMPRQCRFHSLGVASGHTQCIGSMNGRVVPTSGWFELDMEAQAGRACSWDRVDAGGAGEIGGVRAGPRAGVGFGET